MPAGGITFLVIFFLVVMGAFVLMMLYERQKSDAENAKRSEENAYIKKWIPHLTDHMRMTKPHEELLERAQDYEYRANNPPDRAALLAEIAEREAEEEAEREENIRSHERYIAEKEREARLLAEQYAVEARAIAEQEEQQRREWERQQALAQQQELMARQAAHAAKQQELKLMLQEITASGLSVEFPYTMADGTEIIIKNDPQVRARIELEHRKAEQEDRKHDMQMMELQLKIKEIELRQRHQEQKEREAHEDRQDRQAKQALDQQQQQQIGQLLNNPPTGARPLPRKR